MVARGTDRLPVARKSHPLSSFNSGTSAAGSDIREVPCCAVSAVLVLVLLFMAVIPCRSSMLSLL
ncbi:hypothetical protein GCM10025734_08800 [Kitasatospora paranensis]